MLSFKVYTEVLRHSRVFFTALAFLLFAPIALHATPITYGIALTQTSPSGTTYSGGGQVTLNLAGAPQNFINYQSATGLTGMAFTIGGQTFNMNDATNEGNATFTFLDLSKGSIWDITFAETLADGYRLVMNGETYTFLYENTVLASGTFSVGALPTAPAPEPASFALLGTGLLAGAGGLYRRIRLQRS